MPPQTLEYATRLAALGLSVIPIVPGPEKRPGCRLEAIPGGAANL